MKIFFRVLLATALTSAATGCKSFLDVNSNPNNATSVTPDALLGTALVTTAANYSGAATNYNSYASFAVGYWGKSGTVSGFSEERTYNYSSTYYQGLWNATYDNLSDYNLIQQQGATSGYQNHAAIARIMKVYNFLLLVDEYGDIPYTNALQGIANTIPTYDKATDIYKDLVVQLKGAVTDINAAPTSARAVSTEDVVFGGNMTRWKQFANSLRLRILLRESSTNDAALNSYVTTEMATLQSNSATDGYITTDVVVQPGYAANTNQQNPFYNRYGIAAGATRANAEYSYIVPSKYIIRQYEGDAKNSPASFVDGRIAQLYTVGTIDSVAAYSGTDLGEANPPQFDPTTTRVGSRLLLGGAFLRGATAPTVLMLLSEHLFSKAEAETRSLLTNGNAKQDFLDGIQSSFLTTFRAATTAPIAVSTAVTTTAGVSQYNAYINAPTNANNGLVIWEKTTTTVPNGTDATTTPLATPRAVSNQEKILYQKYLAENTIASTEAWDDFRRTGLPKFKISAQAGTSPLPKRLIYPQTEVSTNNANIPTGVTQFTRIFWESL
ncbi:MAG: SusD/RagB family nutrient-binding outer membrane lipoprotein [Janthinobacterium lividum]